MALQFQFRRGTTAQTNAFTGALGEVTVDMDKDTLVVHDGATVGGFPLAKASQLPSQASSTTQGLIEIATQAEVNTGTDTSRAIVPSLLLGGIKTHLNADGLAPVYGCRAWINFRGSDAFIRASGNIQSVARNGVGNYTINFLTSMPHNNYSPQATMSTIGAGAGFGVVSQTATSITLRATYGGDNTIGSFDPDICSLCIFC